MMRLSSTRQAKSAARGLLVAAVLFLTAFKAMKIMAIEIANRAVLQAIVEDHPRPTGGILILGRPFGDQATLAKARMQLLNASSRSVGGNGCSRQFGLLALAGGDRREAARAFSMTDDAVSRFWSAIVAAADKRFEQAARLLSRDYPAALSILNERAVAAVSRGNDDEARVCFEIGARCNVGEDASALIVRGHMHQVLGHYRLALADFDRALASCPACYQAYLFRGQTLLAQGTATSETVEKEFFRAVTLAPRQRDAALQWGHWLLRTQRWSEAETIFKEGVQLSPADLEWTWGLAFTYCRTGRGQDGRFLLQRFLERSTVSNAEASRIRQVIDQCPN